MTRAGPPVFRAFFLVLCASCFAETRWFRSNASGMALEDLSRALALRAEYALSVETVTRESVPAVLRPWFDPAFSVELRIIWRKGAESRRLWVFRDDSGITRLSAAFNSNPLEWPGEGITSPVEGINYGGFVEIYNASGYITGEHRFDPDGAGRITAFFYSGSTLVRAETRIRRAGAAETEPYCSDRYYYNRAAALRAVERRWHSGAGTAGAEPGRLEFSHRIDQAVNSIAFERPQNTVSTGYREEPAPEPGDTVLYGTDSHGRVLSETRRNSEGEVTSETLNAWAGSRLESMETRAGDDVIRTEYAYNDAGDRIIERNYRNGVLERTVRREGDREIEELYMNGQVILRAIWEEGRKISEERIHGGQEGEQ